MHVGPFDTSDRVLVVAEIGNNHEGSLDRARTLVEEAAKAGADAVKFQTFRTEHFVHPSDRERFDRLERFRLTFDDFADLAELARSRGVLFASTALDLESARFLGETADVIKIASGDNDFLPLIEVAARTGKPLVISTGLAEVDQLDRTVAFAEDARGSGVGLALLHCVSGYPTPDGDVNLLAIGLLAERYPGWTIGFSDHTLGLEAAPLAVAAGARIVEKHFTLDKNLSDFRDHRLSTDPPELKALVASIRAAERFAGRREKLLQASEEPLATAARRSIAAAGDFDAGHKLRDGDLTWLRPGDGLPPGEEPALLGRPLRHAVTFGDRLGLEDVE
jgi:N-acetylneuraminate synthase/N,N'-diacetyllegionaminate synthase